MVYINRQRQGRMTNIKVDAVLERHFLQISFLTTGPSRRGWSAYVEVEVEEKVETRWRVVSLGYHSVPASRSIQVLAQTPAPLSPSCPLPSYPLPFCQTLPGGATNAPALMPRWLCKATCRPLLLPPSPPGVTNGHPPQVSSCMGYQVTRQGGGCHAVLGSKTSLYLNFKFTSLDTWNTCLNWSFLFILFLHWCTLIVLLGLESHPAWCNETWGCLWWWWKMMLNLLHSLICTVTSILP